MAGKRSRMAMLYTQARYQDNPGLSWDEVARAYDQGMRHAVENRKNARKALGETDLVVASVECTRDKFTKFGTDADA